MRCESCIFTEPDLPPVSLLDRIYRIHKIGKRETVDRSYDSKTEQKTFLTFRITNNFSILCFNNFVA